MIRFLEVEPKEDALAAHLSKVEMAEERLIKAQLSIITKDINSKTLGEYDAAIAEHVGARCDGIPQKRSIILGIIRFNLPPNYLARV